MPFSHAKLSVFIDRNNNSHPNKNHLYNKIQAIRFLFSTEKKQSSSKFNPTTVECNSRQQKHHRLTTKNHNESTHHTYDIIKLFPPLILNHIFAPFVQTDWRIRRTDKYRERGIDSLQTRNFIYENPKKTKRGPPKSLCHRFHLPERYKFLTKLHYITLLSHNKQVPPTRKIEVSDKITLHAMPTTQEETEYYQKWTYFRLNYINLSLS